MAERETKTVTLPSGKTATLKVFLTAREVLGIVKEQEEGTAPDKFAQAEKLMEIAVTEVDGVKEKIAEYAQDLPVQDYLALVKEVTALIEGFQEAK